MDLFLGARCRSAIRAIKRLQYAYGHYAEFGLWHDLADLFARDGKRRLAYISKDKGRENIRQSIKRCYPGKKPTDYFTVHQLIQPVIHVAADGKTARMRLRLFQLGGASGGNGLWIVGVYECKTGIEDGVWKFEAMELDYTWTADYKSRWARISSNSNGIVVAPFPKIVDLPFHYRNPVTGRKPPLLPK